MLVFILFNTSFGTRYPTFLLALSCYVCNTQTHPPNSEELAPKIKQVHGGNGVLRTLVVLVVYEAPPPVLVGGGVRSKLHLLDGTESLKHAGEGEKVTQKSTKIDLHFKKNLAVSMTKYWYFLKDLPLDIIAGEVCMYGGHVDARVLQGLLLDLGYDGGCLRHVVGPANLHMCKKGKMSRPA